MRRSAITALHCGRTHSPPTHGTRLYRYVKAHIGGHCYCCCGELGLTPQSRSRAQCCWIGLSPILDQNQERQCMVNDLPRVSIQRSQADL